MTSDDLYLDQIYMDRLGQDSTPDNWVYYRVTSVEGLGIGEGQVGSSVQICRVTWPELYDIGPAVDSPGVVGFVTAWENVSSYVKENWGAEHAEEKMIGLRDWPKDRKRPVIHP